MDEKSRPNAVCSPNSGYVSFPLLFVLLSTLVVADTNKGIEVHHAWVSEAPPTVRISAGYLKIVNYTDTATRLVRVFSDNYERIEIHRSVTVNDMVSMRPQKSVTIPANSSIEFSPGSYHLMLYQGHKVLNNGDRVLLSLEFADGTISNIQAEVKRMHGNIHDSQ